MSLRLAFTFALSIAVPAAQADTLRTLASFPSGTFLENLAEGPNDTLLVTSYLDRTVLSWDGTTPPVPLANLDVHPVGIVVRNDLIVLSVHGQAFTTGPAFTSTNAFVILAPDGTLTNSIPAPEALFLNGLVEVAPGLILAADSLAGRIWQLDIASGTVTEWLADPLLSPDPAAADQRPGANGLKVHDGWLYVSNSSRGALFRVALRGARPEGSLEVFAQTGPVDDFAFLLDGTIAATSHGASLIGVDSSGAVSTLVATGCDGCTSVLPFGKEGELVILTTGNLLEGGTDPARILSIASPVAD
ncbi:hypothetical protein EI545_12355 [Tabrizicola piscis]|uniref:SMP-30/Gluconolactonase/LRE-like region domain-containing protein n=1 Tax=Tabrizicola piscis TaxID=2494374 RepID=A0A3S8U7C4_9RHOB|nr:hypothetical protein [Tabrizicola piscis]AZL59556.1 hypothetical protein EI545_12355 [Tabrizicola piscis]